MELGFTIFLIHLSFRGYNWFWIFLVGPHVGALLGVGVFHIFLKTELTDWATEYYVSSLKRSANKPVLVAERSDELGLRSQWRLQRQPCRLDGLHKVYGAGKSQPRCQKIIKVISNQHEMDMKFVVNCNRILKILMLISP